MPGSDLQLLGIVGMLISWPTIGWNAVDPYRADLQRFTVMQNRLVDEIRIRRQIGPARDFHGIRAPYLVSIENIERALEKNNPGLYSEAQSELIH